MIERYRPNPNLSVPEISIFGPPPFTQGEDAAAFEALKTRVTSALGIAEDIFVEIWIYEIVCDTWDHHRWRRARNSLVTASMSGALLKALEPLFETEYSLDERGCRYEPHPRPIDKLVEKWAAGDLAAMRKVDRLLSTIKVTMTSIVDAAIVECLEEIERIDRLIMLSAARRNATLREIEFYRAVLAKRLRAKIVEIDTAESKAIETKSTVENDLSKGKAA